MRPVAAIVFDLDQTLFDRQEAVDTWLAGLEIATRDRMRLRQLDQNGYGKRNAFFAAWESVTGRAMDQATFATSLTACLRPERELICRLEALRSRYELAILTNGGAATQHAKLQALALNEVFPLERVFVSSQLGFAKPDRRAFDFAARALGVRGSECVYFGDQLETDVIAARDAGWRAVHVRGPGDVIRHLGRLREANRC